MIYSDFAEIGEILQKTVKVSYPDKVEQCFYETLIAPLTILKSKKKKKEGDEEEVPQIIEIPLDEGLPMGKTQKVTQDTLRRFGILKPVSGSGKKFLLGDKIDNLAKNLVGAVEFHKKNCQNPSFYLEINRKLSAMGASLKKEDFLEFKELVDSISDAEVERKVKELEGLDESVVYGYVTVKGVPLTTTRFYKFYSVCAFYWGSDSSGKMGICSLCGERQLVSEDFVKKIKEVKYFTSTDEQYASNLVNFGKRFKLCLKCLEKMLYFEKQISLFQAEKIIADYRTLVYPSFVFMDSVPPEDYLTFAQTVRDAVSYLNSSDIKQIGLLGRSLKQESEKGNAYAVNVIIYEFKQSSRKIKALWQEIEPLRIAEVMAKSEKLSGENYDYCSKALPLLKEEDCTVRISDFRNLFHSQDSKDNKRSWKNYMDFLGAVLQNKLYDRQKIIDLMATCIYRKALKREYWQNLPFKYLFMLRFLEEIKTVKKERSDVMGILYQQLQERIQNDPEDADLALLYEFFTRQGITSDEKVAAVIVGYLSEKVAQYQRKKNNHGFTEKPFGRELTIAKLKKLWAEALEKANIYCGIQQLNSFLVSTVSAYVAQETKQQSMPCELFLLYMAGRALNSNKMKTKAA